MTSLSGSRANSVRGHIYSSIFSMDVVKKQYLQRHSVLADWVDQYDFLERRARKFGESTHIVVY